MSDLLNTMPLIDGFAAWQTWFENLSPEERVEVQKTAIKLPLVGPIAGPQRQAFNSTADMLGYGGAAGGGKSALMALLVLLKHTRSVIFRNDKGQMRGFIDDLVQFFGTDDGLNRQSGTFYFGDRPGHMMEWGGLSKPGSELVWQGRPHDFIGADEATELDLTKLRFLMTWLRTSIPDQRTRCVYAFNPPGSIDVVTGLISSGRWIVEHFAPWVDFRHDNPAEPGEIRYFVTNGEEEQEVPDSAPRIIKIDGKDEEVIPRSRTFIPATVKDNPYQSENYRQTLLALPPAMRKRMYSGSFRDEVQDHPAQVLPTDWVYAAVDRWDKSGRNSPMTALGVDPARGGAAFTALAARHSLWFDFPFLVPGIQTPEAHYVMSLIVQKHRNNCPINIDSNGIGASVYDSGKSSNMNVRSVMGAHQKGFKTLHKKYKMYNKRAWGFWLMRLLLEPQSGFDVCLPNDKKLISDLVTPHYSDTPKGVLIEPKEDIEKRLNRSVDSGDAVLLSLSSFFEEAISLRFGNLPMQGDENDPYNMNNIVANSAGHEHKNSWMSG